VYKDLDAELLQRHLSSPRSSHFFAIYNTTFFYKPLDMPSANCWSADGSDGSAFHEIVVLPTFAPNIARPQNLGPFQGLPTTEKSPGE
jgi:hypothetical protein